MSGAAAAPTAAALLDPHGWGAPESFPSFEGNATLNVLRPPPASGLRAAAADGFTDDAPALQAALAFAAAKARGLLSISRGRPRATGNGWDLLREAAPR